MHLSKKKTSRWLLCDRSMSRKLHRVALLQFNDTNFSLSVLRFTTTAVK